MNNNDLTTLKGIIKSDLKYPSFDNYNDRAHNLGNHGQLTFIHTERFGWVIATLPISKNRTYGVSVENGAIVSTNTDYSTDVTLYLRKSRMESLQKFVDLYDKGMGSANNIRDRISTRRANTVLRRANYGLGMWA